jgi:hypothetical protein
MNNNNQNLFNSNNIHNILPPDRIKISKKKARDILVIDSRDRNTKMYPNPNKYIYELIETYKNITEIELINAFIPEFETRINKTNNELNITFDGTNKDISFNEGNYWDDDSNNRKGETFINNNLKKYSFIFNSTDNEGLQVFYDFNSNKYIFFDQLLVPTNANTYKSPKIFTLHLNDEDSKTVMYMGNKEYLNDFKKNSAGKFFGFNPKNYSNKITINNLSNYNNKILTLRFNKLQDLERIVYLVRLFNTNLSFYVNGTVLINLGNDDVQIQDIDYNNLQLQLNTYELFDTNGNTVVNIPSINTLTAPIISENIINDSTEPYVLLNIPEFNRFDSIDKTIQNSFALINMSNSSRIFENSNPGNIKYFNPPLPKLDKVSINFLKYNGRSCNFNGINHCLVFSIEYINQPYQLDF